MKKISVLGLGYVGLPTALLFIDSQGFEVSGFDINSDLINNSINNNTLNPKNPISIIY